MNMQTDTPDRGLAKAEGDTKPIENEQEVQQSNDERIDQDFPGFPHHPSTEKEIKKKKDETTGTPDN
jgi:hypothetical protein